MSKRVKTIVLLLFCAALLFGIAPLTAVHAADPTSGACGENLTWRYDAGTKTLTISGMGEMSDYDVSEYNDNWVSTAPWQPYYNAMQTAVINSGVTSIGSRAFDSCTGLTSVTIPDSVTSIGGYAFQECTGLTSVTIPDSVTSIGNWAFDYCNSLTAISVSEGNPNYSSDSFGVLYNKNKTELLRYPIGNTRPSFTIPDSVASIGKGAFSSCSRLTSVTIPDSVTSIGELAFLSCNSLTSVAIPDSVTSIAPEAFELCENLANVTIGNGVTSISDNMLYCCRNLTNVTIGNRVTSIGAQAFMCCKSLTSVTIPDSVTSIGAQAFMECYGLTSVSIPDSVTSIGDSAFFVCIGLTSVTIPDSVSSVGEYAFEGCSKLSDVYYTGSKTQWDRIAIEEYNDPLKNAAIHFNSGKPVVQSVSVSDITVNYKDSVALKPTVTADDGVKTTAEFDSSDPNVVKLDKKNGEVTGLKRGSSTVTVTVTDAAGNTVTDSCTVTVKYTALQWVIIILLFGWIWY